MAFQAQTPISHATDIDVLRRHGLYELADWAENLAIAPYYAQQLAYWSCVLCAPAHGALLEWPCSLACGFCNLAELPFGGMRAVVLSHRHGKGPYDAVSSVIKAQIRDRRCLSECGHMVIFASFSYCDRGDCRVVYGVIVAFRRPPRGVVSRGQVRTRFRLPLSPSAFLDRLEKSIKRKIFCCNTSPCQRGPGLFCGAPCQDPCLLSRDVVFT